MIYNPNEKIEIPKIGMLKIGVPKITMPNVFGKVVRTKKADGIVKGKTIIVTATSDTVDMTINGVKKTYTVTPNKPSKIVIDEHIISNGLNKLFYNINYLIEADLTNLDVSNVVYFNDIFNGCNNLVKVNCAGINTAKLQQFIRSFQYCWRLKYLDFSNCDFGSVYRTDSFLPCERLTDLKFGYNLKCFITLQSCPLTHESALSVIDGLAEVSTLQTVTFKSSTYNTLSEEEIALATSKGWRVVSA